MARYCKALPLTLALMALSVAMTLITIGCTSNGTANVRVINAIPDASSALDVDFNGGKTVTDLAFGAVNPAPATPATYFDAIAGPVSVEAFLTGQTKTPVVDLTRTTLNGGSYYTVLLAGFSASPAAYLISDENIDTPLTSGLVKFRVINASASSSLQYPSGFDIYIVPAGQPITGIPAISGLTLGQIGLGGYITFNYSPEYSVWLTAHNNTLPLFNPPATFAQSNPQVTTLVIVDEPGGTSLSPTMLSLVDLK